MLFPAVFTVARAASVFHTPTAWVGIILCLSPLSWVVQDNPVVGRWVDTFLHTIGWATFIIAAAVWAVSVPVQRTAVTHAHGGTLEP